MKLQDLHVLMTVVQAGSMRKAAALLNTSQPAISRSIADLEDAVGVRLLERHHQGIEPTGYGRALLDCGVTVFDDLRQGVKNIEFLADPTAGEIRVGSNHFLAASFVAAVVDRISQRYPRIVFHLVTTQTQTLYRNLHERNLDLLIAWKLGSFADEAFEFETLYDDSHVVVADAQNPWARRRKIVLAELMNESWVLPPPDGLALGPIYLQAFRASGLDYPRTTVFTMSPEVRTSFLVTGRFLTIFPEAALKISTRRPALKVLPVELPIASVPVGIITLRNRVLSPVARLFSEHAREVAKQLAKRVVINQRACGGRWEAERR